MRGWDLRIDRAGLPAGASLSGLEHFPWPQHTLHVVESITIHSAQLSTTGPSYEAPWLLGFVVGHERARNYLRELQKTSVC